MQISKEETFSQFNLFPPTRYMGSKEKLIPALYDVFKQLNFNSAIDLMSGTNAVAYLLKCMGKEIYANDYMNMNFTFAKALIENNSKKTNDSDTKKLILENKNSRFISKKFKDLYFSDDDSIMIDNINNNIQLMKDSYEKAIAQSALIRACIKKRPRGIFAYTGMKYDDGRKDLRLSINDHFLLNIKMINKAVFSNKKNNKAMNEDSMNVMSKTDLIYIDPPYFSPLSDNEYVRRYHFVEGLSRNWKDIEFQEHTKTKKFKSYPSAFTKLESTINAFESIIKKYANSDIVISYSSNALPDKSFFLKLLRKYKKHTDCVSVDYRYSFSNQGFAKDKIKNKVNEYIFLGTDK